MSIPVIDLTAALTPGAARSAEVAAAIRQAAMHTGFFYIRNHGVAAEQVARQFALAAELMAVPDSSKQALSVLNSADMRGYETTGAQTLDANAHPDVKESFQCGMEYPAEHPYALARYHGYGPSQWPAEVPHAKAQCAQYSAEMLRLSCRLMQLIALSLGLDEHHFDDDCIDPMVSLRMIRYPRHPADADERTFGAGAHTDWGAVTILAQDQHGGLEVRLPDGSWAPATPIEGTFVVNLGDMIPRWTNDLYLSTLHRVRNVHSGGQPRYSIPFFFEPHFLARIEALPGTVPAGEQPRYASCTSGEHLVEMYHRTYGVQQAANA